MVTSGMQHLAFSGLRSDLARISFFATGDRSSLRKAKRCIPKTLATIKKNCLKSRQCQKLKLMKIIYYC